MTRVPLVLALLLAAASPAAAQQGSRYYVSAAGGFERSRDTRLVDASCDSSAILFFGCGPGSDERQLGASGDVGGSPVLDVAVGVRLSRHVRAEAALASAAGYDLAANANFLNAGARQPVTADVRRIGLMGRAFVDLTPLNVGRLEPFVGVGGGLSRQRVSDVLYGFPELSAQPATTTTPGGSWRGFAWDGSAGVGLRVTPRIRIDLSYRYTDAGHIDTGAGAIRVVRGARSLTIDGVGGTRGDMTSHAMLIGLRGSF